MTVMFIFIPQLNLVHTISTRAKTLYTFVEKGMAIKCNSHFSNVLNKLPSMVLWIFVSNLSITFFFLSPQLFVPVTLPPTRLIVLTIHPRALMCRTCQKPPLPYVRVHRDTRLQNLRRLLPWPPATRIAQCDSGLPDQSFHLKLGAVLICWLAGQV